MPDPLMVKLEKQLTGLKEKARTLCEATRAVREILNGSGHIGTSVMLLRPLAAVEKELEK